MTFAGSNFVALRYVPEVTFGTTPASPAMQALRYTSESLNYNADFITSQEIRSDRMTPDTIQVGAAAEGDINGELSYGTYDPLIEAAMFGTWTTTGSDVAAATDISIDLTASVWTLGASSTDFTAQSWVVGQFIKVEGFAVAGAFYAEIVEITSATALIIAPLTAVATEAAGDSIDITALEFVRNGVTKKSFTMQKEFTDLTTPEFMNFTGARVSTMSFELATASILNTSFSMMALNSVMTETQFASATEPAANTNQVMNAVDNVAAIAFDGNPSTTYSFSSLSIEVNNNLRGQSAIGTLGYIGVEAGRLSITGSIELYFEDSTLFDNFTAATAFSLSFVVEDAAGNAYIINMPRVKHTSMDIVAGGLDQDILASADFEAIINTAGTYQMQVVRTPSA
jgi:hypothetical protein